MSYGALVAASYKTCLRDIEIGHVVILVAVRVAVSRDCVCSGDQEMRLYWSIEALAIDIKFVVYCSESAFCTLVRPHWLPLV